MAFNESLAERIRQCLIRRPNVIEQKMFGCLAFMINGNALVGVWNDSLIVRVGGEAYEDSLMEPTVSEFDITGKAMRGWVVVSSTGIESDDQLDAWVSRASAFVATLPAK